MMEHSPAPRRLRARGRSSQGPSPEEQKDVKVPLRIMKFPAKKKVTFSEAFGMLDKEEQDKIWHFMTPADRTDEIKKDAFDEKTPSEIFANLDMWADVPIFSLSDEEDSGDLEQKFKATCKKFEMVDLAVMETKDLNQVDLASKGPALEKLLCGMNFETFSSDSAILEEAGGNAKRDKVKVVNVFNNNLEEPRYSKDKSLPNRKAQKVQQKKNPKESLPRKPEVTKRSRQKSCEEEANDSDIPSQAEKKKDQIESVPEDIIDLVTCPMCPKKFPADSIDLHAFDCCGVGGKTDSEPEIIFESSAEETSDFVEDQRDNTEAADNANQFQAVTKLVKSTKNPNKTPGLGQKKKTEKPAPKKSAKTSRRKQLVMQEPEYEDDMFATPKRKTLACDRGENTESTLERTTPKKSSNKEVAIPCPVCQAKFPPRMIEAHASVCNDGPQDFPDALGPGTSKTVSGGTDAQELQKINRKYLCKNCDKTYIRLKAFQEHEC